MGDRIINLLHLILMVVEPFYFYLASLDEVKCLVDDNSNNSGYIDIYILHLALLIIISICFYNQLRLVRLLQSGLFPTYYDLLRNPDGVHGGGMVVPGPDSPEDDKAL